MNLTDKIRAWKEPAYRASISATELDNPAGMIELTGTALDVVSGGGGKAKCGKGSGKSHKSSKSHKSKKSHGSGKSCR